MSRQGEAMSGFIDYIEYGMSASGKTKRVEARSKGDGSLLALISWHGPWRKYVAHFQDGVIFDAGCLRDLSAELERMMHERSEER